MGWQNQMEMLLAELRNQKRGICKHHILYLLRLRPRLPNDIRILKPKVGLGLDQMKIDLKKVFIESITYFWIKYTIFGKKRPRKL